MRSSYPSSKKLFFSPQSSSSSLPCSVVGTSDDLEIATSSLTLSRSLASRETCWALSILPPCCLPQAFPTVGLTVTIPTRDVISCLNHCFDPGRCILDVIYRSTTLNHFSDCALLKRVYWMKLKLLNLHTDSPWTLLGTASEPSSPRPFILIDSVGLPRFRSRWFFLLVGPSPPFSTCWILLIIQGLVWVK